LIRPLVTEIENTRKADKSILFQIVLGYNVPMYKTAVGSPCPKGDNDGLAYK